MAGVILSVRGIQTKFQYAICRATAARRLASLRRPLLADLGVAQGGSDNGAVGRELGDVLCGVGARRQEGRGLPQATLLRPEGAPTGSRPNVKLSHYYCEHSHESERRYHDSCRVLRHRVAER